MVSFLFKKRRRSVWTYVSFAKETQLWSFPKETRTRIIQLDLYPRYKYTSWYTYEYVMSHISHVTNMNEEKYEWVSVRKTLIFVTWRYSSKSTCVFSPYFYIHACIDIYVHQNEVETSSVALPPYSDAHASHRPFKSKIIDMLTETWQYYPAENTAGDNTATPTHTHTTTPTTGAPLLSEATLTPLSFQERTRRTVTARSMCVEEYVHTSMTCTSNMDTHVCHTRRGGGLGSRPIFKKVYEPYAPS